MRSIDVEELKRLQERAASENVYLFDVRSREEYEAGHIPGFGWVPGGQAVQATDNYVAVTDAIIVFACDGIVRAAMTASWFRQMGYANAVVLDGGTTIWQQAGLALEAGMRDAAPHGFHDAAADVSQRSRPPISTRMAPGRSTQAPATSSSTATSPARLGYPAAGWS